MPTSRRVRRLLATGLAALVAATWLIVANPHPAAAVVTPLHGFRATVDGFTSWYGSYAMGSLGTAWCIDHGSRAPDPAYGYVPTSLPGVSADTTAAMAWVLGAHGQGTDRVGHAAVMLVMHDLMGARYPSGDLNLDHLSVTRLAGFGGLEAQVLGRARMLKADGLAHRRLRGPLVLTLTSSPPSGSATVVTARMTDAAGRPVAGIKVHLDSSGARLRSTDGTTGVDGRWRTEARPEALPVTIRATSDVPGLLLDAWAPTTRAAQRVARPARDNLRASVRLAAPPPTTTTTLPPPTTVPPTTTTTTEATTTTTQPPPSTTSTTEPATTTSTTEVPPTTTSTVPATTTTEPLVTTTTTAVAAAPSSTSTTSTMPAPAVSPSPPPTAPEPPPPAALPRTGRDVMALVLVALGLLLLGWAALDVAQPSAPDARKVAIRSSS